jgi:hypothetical protein
MALPEVATAAPLIAALQLLAPQTRVAAAVAAAADTCPVARLEAQAS